MFLMHAFIYKFKTGVDILLPLWTGVDILFHFACIISHSVDKGRFVFLRFPRAPIFSQEIWGSTVSILCQCISHQTKRLDLKKILVRTGKEGIELGENNTPGTAGG